MVQAVIERIGSHHPFGGALGAAPQADVAPGGTIRANKTWRNVGATGNRDVIAMYGTGTNLENFVSEFGVVAVDRPCAADAQVTTPVDCEVPAAAPVGLRNALVGVGKSDPVTSAITFDDYEIVVDAINVVVPALAGTIEPGNIWYEGLPSWTEIVSGRVIPQAEDIHLSPLWENNSAVSIVGHVDLAVTYPDGTTVNLVATINQDKEAAPGNGWYVMFGPFISSQLGTYTLEATLSCAGAVLDSVSFTLVTTVPTEPTGEQVACAFVAI